MAAAAKVVKAAVAGSQVEAATAISAETPIVAQGDGSQVEAVTAVSVGVPTVAQFPRDVLIVNETAIPYVIAGTFVKNGESIPVTVKSDDEITRMKSDCEQIMALNTVYHDAPESPLRVIEAT